MSKKVTLNKTVFDKNQYSQLVNTEFSTTSATGLGVGETEPEEEPDVEDFFEMYNDLFYDIPQFGEEESHEFLIQRSSEYINFEANQDEIEALQREIAELRTELLNEQQKNIELTTGSAVSLPTVGEGENTAGTNSGTPTFS